MNCWILLVGRMNSLMSSYNSTFIFQRRTKWENYVNEWEWLLLNCCLRACLSWNVILTQCCVLNWVTKILRWAILNVHGGRRFPTSGVGIVVGIFCICGLLSCVEFFLYKIWLLTCFIFLQVSYPSAVSNVSARSPNVVINQKGGPCSK